MAFLGHKRAICSFSFLALVTMYAFGADPDVTYALVDASDPMKGATTTFEVSSVAGFASAVSTINAWTAARTVTVDGMTDPVPDSGRFTISLKADLTNFTGASFTTAGTDVTLLGNGHSLAFLNQSKFWVENATLSLGREGEHTVSALDISRAKSNDEPGVLYAYKLGTIHMYDGVVVHDCVGHNYYGGGATVYGGLLHMHGGIIRNCGIDGGSVCFGGGVAAVDGGRFIMDGGTISGCFVQSDYTESSWQVPSTVGGGVLVYGSSSFIMNGGTIENCTADTGHGAGGGVALIASQDSMYTHNAYGWVDSAFVMNGGTIRGCSSAYTGGGVAVYGTYLNVKAIGYNAVVSGMNEFQSAPATATEEEKAAIAAAYAPAPGLWINGGKINDCETDGNGGGVFLTWIRGNINTSVGEATISGCSAEKGGGMAVFSYWTQLKMDGTTVSGNLSGNGGGVWLSGNSSSNGTTMRDVSVTDNVATDADGVGGIYYKTDSKLTISGAMDVSGNVAGSERKDSNLYCQGHSYPFYISGSLEGSTIGLTDTLLDAGGADSDVFLSSGYDANNPSVHPYARVFTSDHAGWYADYGDESVTTTTTSMQETTMRVDSSMIKCTWYLYAYTPAHDNKYRTQLYWNVANQCLTATETGNLTAGLIQFDGKSYIAAYSDSGAVYSIRIIKELDSTMPNLSTYPTFSSLGLTLDSTVPSDRTDAGSGTLKDGYSTITYNIIEMEEVTTTSSTPDYSAEVRLVKGGATLTGARQRYPWNNFIDFSWTAEGRAGGWLFDFSVEDLGQKDVTAAAALKDAADTTRAAGDAVAGENRVAWDAPADGFARMATNCVVTMKCYRDAAERTAGTPFVTGVISNLAFDTHYDFTTGGYGVRVVADPATDILPITYSSTNFVWKGTDVADATGVYGVLANTNEAGAFFDCSSTNLLNSAAGEGAFGWHGNAFDFVKLVHSNELGQTVAYFKFPPLTFSVTQRELEEKGKTDDDAKRSIILSPMWLEDYGIYKVGATDEEVEQLLHDLDTVQPNGCRMWENVVLGNVQTNLLVATVPTMEADALKLALPMTSPAPGYGYKVLYELRRAKVGMVQRDAQHENLHIDLCTRTSGRTRTTRRGSTASGRWSSPTRTRR